MRRDEVHWRFFSMSVQWGKRNIVGEGWIFLGSHDSSEQISSGLQKRFMRPVCEIQITDQATSIFHFLRDRSENGDICSSKAVNRLSSISYDEQPPKAAR